MWCFLALEMHKWMTAAFCSIHLCQKKCCYVSKHFSDTLAEISTTLVSWNSTLHVCQVRFYTIVTNSRVLFSYTIICFGIKILVWREIQLPFGCGMTLHVKQQLTQYILFSFHLYSPIIHSYPITNIPITHFR